MATRERSLHGGTVFVVNPEVIERLGVETSAVELKPSQAEVAAAAVALKAEKAAESAAAVDDDGVNTTPGGTKVGRGFGAVVQLFGWLIQSPLFFQTRERRGGGVYP